jgi:hypothetical protein
MPATTEYQMGLPPFVADRDSLDHDGGHTIDWASVGEEYRRTPGQTVTMAAAASAGAVSLTVEALTYAIPSGTTLNFTGAGEFAITTADAAAGATALAVEATDAAIEDDDTAIVAGSGDKFIPAGTRMGGGANWFGGGPMWPRSASNPAACLLATDAIENSRAVPRSGYGVIVGGVIFENLLPGATGTPKRIASAERTELAAAGTGFTWRQYGDSSAS